MADIPLMTATEGELGLAVEENLFALFRAMTVLEGSELVEGERVSYHLSFPSNPMFKGVWRTRVKDDEAEAVIEETLGWFRDRKAPFAFWWVGSQTQPDDLAERLVAHGLAANVVNDPGMAVELEQLGAVNAPAGYETRAVWDAEGLADWRDVFVAAFGVPEWAGQAWADATLALGKGAPWTMYVGYLDGRAVACNILFMGGGVASVYGVGTVPDVRGRGVGTAITLQPLLEARAAGYRYGVLFATEMGYGVYERMGFRRVPCSIGRYLWVNG